MTGGIFWGIVELGVAIITACMPTVYSLFFKFASASRKRSSGRNNIRAYPSAANALDRTMNKNHGYERWVSSEGSDVELAQIDRIGSQGSRELTELGKVHRITSISEV